MIATIYSLVCFISIVCALFVTLQTVCENAHLLSELLSSFAGWVLEEDPIPGCVYIMYITHHW